MEFNKNIRILSELRSGYNLFDSKESDYYTALSEGIRALTQELKTEEAPEITEDELKAYANEKGYKLIKKQPHIKLEECPFCGHLPKLWAGNHGYRYECNREDHVERIAASEWTKSKKAARLSWNDMCNKEKENQNANMD